MQRDGDTDCERERERKRRADEETEVEVEEDNIDPLVAPPLLAQPTPSLYYPPSLRLRFPTYAHIYDLLKLAKLSRLYARVLFRASEEGLPEKGEEA